MKTVTNNSTLSRWSRRKQRIIYMKKNLLILLITTTLSNQVLSFELHLLCKSYSGEVEIFIDDGGESWISVPTFMYSQKIPKEMKREIIRLNITDDLIDGYWKLGMILKEPFSINRKTGSITIRGFDKSNFNGDCKKYSEVKNKF